MVSRISEPSTIWFYLKSTAYFFFGLKHWAKDFPLFQEALSLEKAGGWLSGEVGQGGSLGVKHG